MKKHIMGLALTALVAGVAITTAAQAKEVVIGVLYPLTGPVAQVGKDAVANDDADVRTAQPGQALALGERHVEIV